MALENAHNLRQMLSHFVNIWSTHTVLIQRRVAEIVALANRKATSSSRKGMPKVEGNKGTWQVRVNEIKCR